MVSGGWVDWWWVVSGWCNIGRKLLTDCLASGDVILVEGWFELIAVQ